jgi:hypothetical protein
MVNKRDGYVRVMGEIPEEIHDKIKRYNSIADFPLNVSRMIENYICDQMMKYIDMYVLDEVQKRGLEHIASTEYYNAIVSDIQSGKPANEVYKNFIEMLKRDGYEMKNTGVWLPIYPITDYKLNPEDKKQVVFIGGTQYGEQPCVEVRPFNLEEE